MTTAQKPDALPVVAHLVTNLRSGEPSLCFEDERGDYGDEDHTPVFEALVLLSDAQASLLAKEAECEALRVKATRYDWLCDQHEASDSAETFCVFEPDWAAKCLQPVGSKPGELDVAIDAARAAADQGGAS